MRLMEECVEIWFVCVSVRCVFVGQGMCVCVCETMYECVCESL